MVSGDDPDYYRDRALDGSQAAAAWALRLLADKGAPEAAGELLEALQAMEPTTRRIMIVQLVNLVGRTASRPQVTDVAMLRRYLEVMVSNRVSSDVADEAIRRVRDADDADQG